MEKTQINRIIMVRPSKIIIMLSTGIYLMSSTFKLFL